VAQWTYKIKAIRYGVLPVETVYEAYLILTSIPWYYDPFYTDKETGVQVD